MSSLSFFLFFLFSVSVSAESLTLDFNQRSELAQGDLIFNQSLGVLHPSLQVENYEAPAPTPLDFSVGDGRHGIFDNTTYQKFSLNGDTSGQKITIDVTEYPILQVTDFVLDAGWVIEVVGNGPLIIYSLKDVKIAGEIWCHGEDALAASGTTPSIGGKGRCGGGNGSDGALATQNASNGDDVSVNVTGGQGGNYTGSAVSGGGGGSWNTSVAPSSGTNANVSGGSAGTSFADSEFTTIAGGAGGGGGSGSTTAAGAGGGGGGGAVIIHTVRDFYLGELPSSTTGSIKVSGGKGGDSNADGGAGGGGGGGSIQVFAGRNIELLNTIGTGASRAAGGTGGTNLSTDNGGNGGTGRSWFSSVGYNTILGGGGGTYFPTEQFPPLIPGNARFNPATQSMESVSFDLRNTKPTITSVTFTPSSSDFSYQLRASNDDFVSDDTGWTSDLGLIAGKRYVKIKVLITTSSTSAPTMLDSVSINYNPLKRDQFDFTAASCGAVKTPPRADFLFWLLLPFTVLIFLRKQSFRISNPK